MHRPSRSKNNVPLYFDVRCNLVHAKTYVADWNPALTFPLPTTVADLVAVISDPPEGLDLGEGFHFLVTEVCERWSENIAMFGVALLYGVYRLFCIVWRPNIWCASV